MSRNYGMSRDYHMSRYYKCSLVPRPCIILNENQRTKNGRGLGTRLLQSCLDFRVFPHKGSHCTLLHE